MRKFLRRILPAVILLAAAPAFAESPLANLVPEDAVLYSGWRGTDAMGDAYAKSNLKGVLDAIDFTKLFTAGMGTTGTDNPGEAYNRAIIKLYATLGPAITKYPAVMYFGGITDFTPAKPTPKLVFFLKCGKDQAEKFAPDLQKQIDDNPERKADDPKAKAEVAGDFLLLTIGDGGDIKDRLITGKSEKPLSDNKDFQAAEAQTGKDAAFRVYVNGTAALKLIDSAVDAKAPDQFKQMWPRLADGFGIDGIKSITMAGNFDGADWSTQVFVGMIEKRNGALTLFDNPPLSDAALKLIPKSAAWAGVIRLNGEKIMKEVRDAATRSTDNGSAMVDQALTRFTDFTGVDIEKEIIANFGDEFVYYAVPDAKGSALADLTLVNKVKDGAALEKALDNLTQIAGTFAGRGDAGFKVATEKAGDIDIHTVSWKTGGFAWVVKDNTWILSLTPEAVQAALIFATKGGDDITANPEFAAAMKRLNHAKPSSFTFADLSKVGPESYELFKENRELEQKGAAKEKNAMPFPDYDKLKPFFTTSASVRWSDKDGFHLAGIGPFPGADLFSGEMALNMKMQRTMIEARHRATATASAANLKQIGAGVAIYAADNNDKLPADLAALIKSQAISPMVLIRDRSALPSDWRDLSTQEQSKYALDHTDYAFVGGGTMGNDAATRVLAYEKSPVPTLDKLNVLYADGHVELLTQKELDAKLK